MGLVLVAGVLGAVYLIYSSAFGGEPGGDPPRQVRVNIVKGDTLSQVAAKLEDKGVIRSASLFEVEARVKGDATSIKTGRYTFRPGTSYGDIMGKLTAGKAVPTIAVTIPEGLTIDQTARVVAAGTGIPAKAFEEAARQTDYGYAFLERPGVKTTEGFLFPARYDFDKGVTAQQVVDTLLGQYLVETRDLDFSSAEDRLDLTEYQILTVASLIEKESANAKERPEIASVIYNRLRKGMPLQIDATVQYALKKPKANLSYADLRVNSPYNTYERKGLPPGPICSPSLQSIEAAIHPAKTDYLYYVLKASGEEHFFTNSYGAFLKAKKAAGR